MRVTEAMAKKIDQNSNESIFFVKNGNDVSLLIF